MDIKNMVYEYIDIIEYTRRGMYKGVEACIRDGEDVNVRDRYDISAMMVAIDRWDLKIITLLLDGGAIIDTGVLNHAKRRGSPEIVALISSYQAK
jgi:hypothetical protein